MGKLCNIVVLTCGLQVSHGVFACDGLEHQRLRETIPVFSTTKVYPFPDIDFTSATSLAYRNPDLRISQFRDQCSGTCWANGTAILLDYLTGEPSSANYLVATRILFEAERSLDSPEAPKKLTTGVRSIEEANPVLKEWGVASEAEYPSRIDIETRDVISQVNTLITEFHSWRKGRQFGIKAQRKKTLALIRSLIETNYGKLPNQKAARKRYQKATTTMEIGHFKVEDFDREALGFIRERIAGGSPVGLTYFHIHQALDSKTGKMRLERQLEELSKDDGSWHQVVIINFDRIEGQWYFKVLNSHSNSIFMHIPISYLRHYTRSLSYLIRK